MQKTNWKTEHYRQYYREYWRKNIEKKRRLLNESHNRPEVKKRKYEYNKLWAKNIKNKPPEVQEKIKMKDRARKKVRYYIQKGTLKRLPCETCGEVKSEAHHEDHTKPLEVNFLCKKHHSEKHRKL